MSADRSTMDNWLRKMEKAADEYADDGTDRAWAFRDVLNAAWRDGQARGYDDCRDDHSRAAAVARRTAREAAPPTPEEH